MNEEKEPVDLDAVIEYLGIDVNDYPVGIDLDDDNEPGVEITTYTMDDLREILKEKEKKEQERH